MEEARKDSKPELVVLVGVMASGKSTISDMYKENGYVIAASDEVRARLWGDASIQGDNRIIFDTVQRECADAIMSGKSAVYDATNIGARSRKEAIKQVTAKCEEMGGAEFTKKCVVSEMSLPACRLLNALRDRKVPEEVQESAYRRMSQPQFSEGFDEIKKVHIPLKTEKVVAETIKDKESFQKAVNLSFSDLKDKKIMSGITKDEAQFILHCSVIAGELGLNIEIGNEEFEKLSEKAGVEAKIEVKKETEIGSIQKDLGHDAER